MNLCNSGRSAYVTVLMLLLGIACTASLGCRGLSAWNNRGWVADYDSAEQRALEAGDDILIWYLDPRPGKESGLREILDSPVVKSRTRDYVCCRLFKAYEPDRRYVAQFGVERAPALIVVHADGTYQSLTGPMSTDIVYSFLIDSVSSGEAMASNRHIPRRVRYHWHHSAASAREESESTGKPILFVFCRRFTRDRQRLEKLLTRQEVYKRFTDMVHCRLNSFNPWTKAYITEFGALKLPALVIADRDGSNHVLEMPASYEAVVRFADLSRESSLTASVQPARTVAQP